MYKKIISIFIICFILLSHTLINAETENATVTRAELANVAMETYEYVTQEFSFPMSERPAFIDIKESQFQIRILQVYIKGFMNGVGDEMFLPDENVTKCQAAAVLYRLVQYLNKKYNFGLDEKSVAISDFETVPEWGIEATNYMISTGLFQLEKDKFNPNKFITENELNNAVEKIKEIYSVFYNGERIDFQTFLESFIQSK